MIRSLRFKKQEYENLTFARAFDIVGNRQYCTIDGDGGWFEDGLFTKCQGLEKQLFSQFDEVMDCDPDWVCFSGGTSRVQIGQWPAGTQFHSVAFHWNLSLLSVMLNGVQTLFQLTLQVTGEPIERQQ